MLEIQRIRTDKEGIIEGLKKRHFDAASIIETILDLDQQWRTSKMELESIAAEMNQISKQVGLLFREGKQEEANAAKAKTGELKSSEADLKVKVDGIDAEIQTLMYQLPNVPNELVKAGKSEEDNEIIEAHGSAPNFKFVAKPHWELTTQYNLIDFELGVKITGAGFPIYRGKGAKLQRALINFFLAEADTEGYEEVIVPHMVNEASAIATGQLPDKEGQMYHVNDDNLYLIPTAEVPVTNIFRNTIVKSSELPICLTSYTPCFRREAGSYGAHVRGLNRLHQFDKVEIVRIENPETSYQSLDLMVEHVKNILIELELPFRILRLCGGDLGNCSCYGCTYRASLRAYVCGVRHLLQCGFAHVGCRCCGAM